MDRFKQYNDNYGHPAGDEVLRLTAGLLRGSIREGDFVARYGGEEFAILLPNTESDEALLVAERIRSAVETFSFPWRKVTVSIGVSAPMAGAVAPQSLVESADRALYAAKHAGRNRVALGEAETAGMARMEWIEKSAGMTPAAQVDVDEIAELADGLLRVLNSARRGDQRPLAARGPVYFASCRARHRRRASTYSRSRSSATSSLVRCCTTLARLGFRMRSCTNRRD